jgi:hypothetical protein
VRRNLLLILSSCLIYISCSSASFEGLTKEQIVDNFRSSSQYQVYKRSDKLYAQVVSTFIIEPAGIRISTMNSGETQAFLSYIDSQKNLSIKQVNYEPISSLE